MHGLNMYDYGACQQDPAVGMFTSMDPLCGKYYNISPYSYCAGNPIRYVDPDGREVIADSLSQINIINALTYDESKYVEFDYSGLLNSEKLQQCESISENFKSLIVEAQSDIRYIYECNPKCDKKFGFKETENGGYYGLTLMPLCAASPSPDMDVHIYTASFASEEKKATNCAHEGFGHGLFYEISRKCIFADPLHRWITIPNYEDWSLIRVDSNILLKNQITTVENEAKKNYYKYHLHY